ncbi:MAG: response regulator [Clostridia bacterium]|nr:response regulator [Clostridia bacterium]
MNKYKVVLADDEREIFGRLDQIIAKTDDFEIVGSVGNGYDAFHLVGKFQPDILITDVVMPFINGIELVKMVKQNYPLVKIAIVSGANNFEYTKEAIDLDVIGYLRKPVLEEDVNNLLDKIRDLFKREELELMTENLRKKYEMSMENAIENILAINMLGGLKKSSLEELAELGFSFSDNIYSVAFVTPYKPELNKMNFKENYYLIKHIATEILQKSFNTKVVQFEDGILFFVMDKKGEFSKKLNSTFFEIIKTVEHKLKTELLVCISNEYDDFSKLHDAYLDTQNVMYSEWFVDFGKIILASDIVEDNVEKIYLAESDILKIEKCIRVGTKEDLSDLFDALDKKLFSSKQYLSQEYLCISLSNILLKYARDCNVKMTDFSTNNLVTELMEFNNSQKLFDHFISLVFNIREKNRELKIHNSEKILNEAIQYVDLNFDNPNLSLELVCDEVGVSVSHLSMLFKKKKGINFIKYLINHRMEKAKKLFCETDLSVIEISIKCGYSNVYYFSHSFKKYTGKTPGGFRGHESDK